MRYGELDWAAWWASVPPEFAFLLGLPVLVALAGAIGAWRERRPRGGTLDTRTRAGSIEPG